MPTEPERWSAAGPDPTVWRKPALGSPTVPAGPAGSPRPLPPTSIRRPGLSSPGPQGLATQAPTPPASRAAQLTRRSPGDAAGPGRTTSAGTRVPDVKPLLRPLGPRRINNPETQAGHLANRLSGGPRPRGNASCSQSPNPGRAESAHACTRPLSSDLKSEKHKNKTAAFLRSSLTSAKQGFFELLKSWETLA